MFGMKYEMITENKAFVTLTVSNYDALTDEQKEEFGSMNVIVESVPNPQYVPRKVPVLYMNPITKELYYDYEDRPATLEEQVSDLIEENLQLRTNNVSLESQLASTNADVMGLMDYLAEAGIL